MTFFLLVVSQIFVPFVAVNDYEWQPLGYVRPPAAVGHDSDLHGLGMWSYDHNPFDCLAEVPLWMSWLYQPDWERCAATAPVLLVLNEPEWGGQSDMTPVEGAEFIRYAEQRWPGELWCCGNLASHSGWLDAMLTAYQAQYGTMPRLAGVHLHVYVNDGFPVADPLSGVWIDRSQADLGRYLDTMQRWGLPARVVVSECCLLGDYPADTYTAAMTAYMTWLRSVPQVETVAWFSARFGGWRHADLVTADGTLTPVGEHWQSWRWN